MCLSTHLVLVVTKEMEKFLFVEPLSLFEPLLHLVYSEQFVT